MQHGILLPVEYRIEVLGPFKLVDLRTDSPVYLRSNGRLLAHLAIQSPRPTTRKALIAALWPGEESKVTANRLRVALTKLRQLLPGAIQEGPDGLSLNSAMVECDAGMFQRLIDESADSSREEDEFDGLLEAIRYFSRHVRTLGFQSWPLDDLEEPLLRYRAACLRLGELGLRLRREVVVGEVLAQALMLWPRDSALWKTMLEARVLLGQGEAAVREISALRERSLLANKDIRPIIDRILKGDAEGQGQTLSTSETKLAAEIMKTMITSRRDTARQILSSPETLTLAGGHPREMLSLLERVVLEPTHGDPHWERCMARIVGLKAWLGDNRGVFEYGHRLVETCTQPLFLRAVWNAIALAHANRREWDEANAAIETTIRYAQETGNKIDLLTAEGNRALFMLHQGRYVEAEAEYTRTLGLIRALGTEQANFEHEMGSGNKAFVAVMQGDWSEALSRLESCHKVRTRGPRKIPMDTLLPCLAMVRMMVGRREEVLPMLRQGFFDANASESERFQQITFEFAACTLARTDHKAFGRSVVNWVEGWRLRTELPRSYAENDLLKRVFGDSPPGPTIPPGEASHLVGRELLGRLRQSI